METKDRILAYLRETPGASTQMVAGFLDVDGSTADYHLRRLLHRGALARQANGRELAWFVVGCGYCPVLRGAIPALRRAPLRAVAAHLEELPATAPALASRAGVSVGGTRWALEALEPLGLASRTPSGRAQLAPGAAVCIQKAISGSPCDQWGRCPPSRIARARGE